ncbi:alpha/beta hydrolase [Luteimicrobium sp. DT211]|uniref:alpha/beta hydrolase n=1 Tax=Luteimicrobium sp. DT211 TaxID=3393412 RepID=UPI003CF29CE7
MPYVPTGVSTGFRMLSVAAPPLAVRLGARAFWRVGPPAPVRPADRPVHERAQRGAVLVGGERVITYRWGDSASPTVLLVHGWQLRASRFAALVVALERAGHGVVAFDGVAHGDSSGHRMSALEHVAAMHAVQDAEGPFTAVVGHSIGGLAAGLALHDGFAADRFVAVAPQAGFDAVAAAFLRLAGLSPRLHDRFCAYVARTFPGGTPDARARVDLATHPAPPTVPTLFVQDVDDRITLPGDTVRLHAAHPGSTFLATRGLGHTRILDDEAVLAAVVGHVAAPLPAVLGR